MHIPIRGSLVAIAFLTVGVAQAAALSTDPIACFREVTQTLAADAMEGRGTGSKGNDLAARNIAQWMDGMGLAAPQGGRMQHFSANTGIETGPGNELDGAQYGKDWIPLGFSRSGHYAGELVFAGYGIRAKDLGYDDYASLEVKGKVVLALRFEPGENDAKSPFDGKKPTRHSELRSKAITAREAGALALILVAPPQSADEPDRLPPLKSMGPLSDAGIPVLQVTRAVADRWLASTGTTLAQAQARIDGNYKPASFAVPAIRVAGRIDLKPVVAQTQNVIGLLPGSGALATQYVVVGAHYDHLGWGGQGSFKPDVRAIHNGADDNASGVAGMLCAARLLAADKAAKGERRTLAFVGFSAEELGLGGSAWFVEHPPQGKVGDVVAMINLDMVGRMREHKLQMLGADSSKAWPALIARANKAAADVHVVAGGDGYGPSDHASFYAVGVPVLHLFTGVHDQYHSPDDDVALLNMDGGGEVARITAALADETSAAPRPDYVRTSASAPDAGDSRGYGAYFGSVPDYSAMEAASGGVKLSDVRANSPAEKGGVRKGDVIVGMAGVTINNLYDMTYVLREHRPGETIDVVLLRDGKQVKLRVTLAQRGGDAAPSAAHGEGASGASAPVTAHADFSVGADPVPAHPRGWAPRAGKAVPELARADERHLADLRRLTFGGENAEAYWSPDGRKLSFQRTPRGGGCDAQYVLDLDTGKVELVSSGKGRTTCGYFDYPKGDSLIYATTEAASAQCPPKPDHSLGYVWATYPSFDIVRRAADGSTRPLLSGPGYDAEATECFKDGRILFTSKRNGDLDLYVADHDGGNVRQLTDTLGYDGGAFFNQDCSKIIWRASRPTGEQEVADYERLLGLDLVGPNKLELHVMDADGGHVKQLTHDGAASFAPYPTPNGKGVLYSSNAGANAREFDIRYVDWNGKQERITTAPGFDGFPMFSPDGKWLVFASNRANASDAHDTDLYIARWVD
ncbi:MAG: M20/M25/M40 family metallo-hydrolase [Dokdonella sp.]|uniref:M20/M25/M40 family metallo-hydrolase n=1 Tax=Dokdonella sp. TaxID=2291710 RepID=UPI0025BA14D2|nr:M20/M25/M40 family metallo-hydrolase [Dokdonella sp.]MBZ0222651.1 M20/M25/M40 family metallo-hydrolase [Dokdonella sp.]